MVFVTTSVNPLVSATARIARSISLFPLLCAISARVSNCFSSRSAKAWSVAVALVWNRDLSNLSLRDAACRWSSARRSVWRSRASCAAYRPASNLSSPVRSTFSRIRLMRSENSSWFWASSFAASNFERYSVTPSAFSTPVRRMAWVTRSFSCSPACSSICWTTDFCCSAIYSPLVGNSYQVQSACTRRGVGVNHAQGDVTHSLGDDLLYLQGVCGRRCLLDHGRDGVVRGRERLRPGDGDLGLRRTRYGSCRDPHRLNGDEGGCAGLPLRQTL